MNVLFWIYKSRANSSGESPIVMRVTYKKQRVNITLEANVHAEIWDVKKQRVRGKSEFAKATNDLLLTCKSKITKAYQVLLEKNISFTSRDIVEVYQGKDNIVVGVLEAFAIFLQNMNAKVGIDFVKPTIIKYNASKKILEKYINTIGKNDIPLSLVDRKMIADFDQFQRGILKRHNNSVNKTHQQVKKMLKYCRVNGWIQDDPYDFYTAKLTPSSKEFLTFQELEPVIRFRSEEERLIRTRDIFLVMCLTGLAHSDIRKLKPDNVRAGVDGKRWIEIKRQKTGVLALIPCLPIVEEIFSKYKDDKACIRNEKVLPVPCSQVLNRNILHLMKTVGIRKHVSSHSCRYTFASTVLMGTGIPIEIAGKLLGHSSLRSTLHYSKLSEKRLADVVVNLGQLVEEKLSQTKSAADD